MPWIIEAWFSSSEYTSQPSNFLQRVHKVDWLAVYAEGNRRAASLLWNSANVFSKSAW
jgi:hypothetical protein